MNLQNKTDAQLREMRRQLKTETTAIIDSAEVAQRDLTATEAREFDRKCDVLEAVSLALAARPQRNVGAPAAAMPAFDARSVGSLNTTRSWGAVARGSLKQEFTYRPDRSNEQPFFRDLLLAREGRDPEAQERLRVNNREAADYWGPEHEQRDMGNSSTAGGDFVPPLYLADLWVQPSMALRPFADALPKYPMPPTGTNVSIPQLASGVSVAARADLGAVSETDGVTANITHDVNEIAGMVDVGRIALMRSEPGLDMVLGRTLNRRFNTYLDSQLLSGTGTAPQHQGLTTLSGIGSVTYTAATPTMAGLLPLIYKAIDTIVEARDGEVQPDLLVMHSRRAGFLAYATTTSIPVLQQGQLQVAFGTQDGGFVDTFAGLEVVIDNNVTTAYGAGTNEDLMYVLAREDFLLSEGPLYTRLDPYVGSGTGAVRIELFGVSAFFSKRYPGSACRITGTGLATPAWA